MRTLIAGLALRLLARCNIKVLRCIFGAYEAKYVRVVVVANESIHFGRIKIVELFLFPPPTPTSNNIFFAFVLTHSQDEYNICTNHFSRSLGSLLQPIKSR